MIDRIFGVIALAFMTFNFSSAQSSDYMSVDLTKAIEIECKKKVKNNDFDNTEECTNSLIETLNVIGVVSITRINNLEMQEEIEGKCVFMKKVGAIK
ncbi:MAG: hypothetical protein QF864_01430 [SAR202 cluster bacterium]|nr:hypothetical protein [SAR202 cluster bacterium]